MTPARRVAIVASHPRWGGGVHLDHLAELLRLPPGDRRLMGAVWHARRLGMVDVWHGWVIAELPVRET